MSDGAGIDTFHFTGNQNVRITPVAVQRGESSSSQYPLYDTRPLEERILDRVDAVREALKNEVAIENETSNASSSSDNFAVIDRNVLPTRELMSSEPMCTRADLSQSRLSQSNPGHSRRSALIIARNLVTNRPFRFFVIPGMICCVASLALCLGQLNFRHMDAGGGNVLSLIFSTLLMGFGLSGIVIGLVSDLISVNRDLLERIDARLQLLESNTKTNESEGRLSG